MSVKFEDYKDYSKSIINFLTYYETMKINGKLKKMTTESIIDSWAKYIEQEQSNTKSS